MDPGQASEVQALSGAGDCYVGKAGFSIINRIGWHSGSPMAARWLFFGAGEVVGDQHTRPFASFRLVGGGDSDLGMWFGDEVGDGGKDGVGAVGVDEVDQRLQIASGGVVGCVVLQVAPGGEEDEFGVVGAAAFSQRAVR